MDFSNIDKNSISYSILKAYVKFAHDKVFYKKICITGVENIPKDKPIFFAPNHQNALMDALIVSYAIKRTVIYIARSDIFSNPLISKILIWLKIMPAYRIRDGKENLKKNKELFDASVKILENNNIITLFPETTHTDLRRLQILKKGVQRIVFQTESANDFNLGIQIVPIGIYYSNYWNFRSTIQINFGKAIAVKDYKKLYHENEQKAMLALRDKMTEEIKPLIIDIETQEFYNTYENIREIYNFEMREKLHLPDNQHNVFVADKKIIEALNVELKKNYDKIKTLDNDVKEYTKALKNFKIRDWVLRKNANFSAIFSKSILFVFLLPIFIYGAVNNIIPYLLPSIITKKLEDRQFESSIAFGFGIVFFPLFYIIQTILLAYFIEPNWLAILYFISLPFTGFWAFSIHRFYVKLKSQWKFFLNKKKPKMESLIILRKKIIKTLNEITEKNTNII
ncbi:MAG: 1-acyl-sn-glycerol-3-phosphate acyltransferase [Bacteroidales bacterium]|nr:1-acyl-sn-glycerol-3-phosphate acyltransferase [Bacteroidales bacterium]MBN2757587.1 1-acyl-sn-glycerol-3-phosphate acyltransferase [Bacteroidales bacterium]